MATDIILYYIYRYVNKEKNQMYKMNNITKNNTTIFIHKKMFDIFFFFLLT